MKTFLGIVRSAAALMCLAPLCAVAQNVAPLGSPLKPTNDVARLTLLPGPELLSPARTTPSMAPAVKPEPAFHFVAPAERFLSGQVGTLKLTERPYLTPSTTSGAIKESTNLPSPDSLQFKSTFDAPRPAESFHFIRGPKPANTR